MAASGILDHFRGFLEMGCDCSIVCDDGTSYWRELQVAEDLGHPVIRVHHGTAEEPGMASPAAYTARQFPSLRVEHLPRAPAYRCVT